ncbi:MAG: hypothetical protein MK110_08675 [Fuerstiella sp.]|nr:hypothetical protein [Fuerstiella sp.]
MQKLSLVVFAAMVFAAGCLVGSSHELGPDRVQAARQDKEPLSGEALLTYKQSKIIMDSLSDMLAAERTHRSVTEGENYFALSVGGIDSLQELEEGRGVDPETFAALYAGLALPNIAQHLEVDDNGRIRYKGNIVRLYSRERLKDVFRRRTELQNRAGSISD